ncbi:MAG: twin-arginine translocase TatA/TatE family subunit [Candidatus Brocadiia bacterium]
MLNNIGAQELLIIFLILVFLFGASKLPSLARGLGKSVKEFKKGMNEEEDKPQTKDEPTIPPATT